MNTLKIRTKFVEHDIDDDFDEFDVEGETLIEKV